MTEKIIEVKDLHKSFGDKEVLKGISLSISKGEVVAILGPSGSGKSTLLRTLNGLEPIQKGEIIFKGKKLELTEKSWQQQRTKIGMVFQSYDLFPNLTVMGNLLLGPIKVQKRSKKEAEEQALLLLDRVGLKDRADSYPRQLSGGQKQRVAIVRALVLQPDLLLFDEVTASLDPEMVREVLEVMRDLAQDGMTMAVVTHEMNFAKKVASRVLFLDEGIVLEDRSSKQFFYEQTNERIISFLNSLGF